MASSTGDVDTELPTDITGSASSSLEAQSAPNVSVVIGGVDGRHRSDVNASEAELDLAGLVSLSAPASFQGIPALDVIDQVGEATLFIAAENDEPSNCDRRGRDGDGLAQVSQLQLFDGTCARHVTCSPPTRLRSTSCCWHSSANRMG